MYLHLLLLVVLGSLAWHFYVHKVSRAGRLVNRIPGPKILPILGNIHNFSFLSLENLWQAIRDFNISRIPVIRGWGIFWPVVGLYDPDDIEVLLTSKKHITKSRVYNCLHQWLGTGLLTSTGAKWQQRRRMLTPSFHFNILERFLESFVTHSKALAENFRSPEGSVVENVVPLVSRCTLNVICETAAGVTLSDMGDLEDSYQRLIDDLGKHIIYRIMRPWLYGDFAFSLTSVGRRHAALVKTLHEFTSKIIEHRKQYHEETGWVHLDTDSVGYEDRRPEGGKKRLAMLDILISNWRRGNIDDAGIREEVDTFVFEGQDTTSRAMSFAILCLAQHQECQERCRKEVDDLFDVRGGISRMADLQQLAYLEQCVKETLRLYPSVPHILRDLDQDMPLKNYVIPAGTIIIFSPYDIHRDPKLWPDPETFDPDRFLPERIAKRHPFSYIPFSGGYRNCIGQKFAMMELKTALAYLLRDFHLEAVDTRESLTFQTDLLLHPTKPINVRFVARREKTT